MDPIARLVSRFALFLLTLSGLAFAQSPSGEPANAKAPAADVASAPTPGNPGTKAHDDSYVIGNDDHLAISVWKEPELTKTIPVRSDGKISMPLVGEIQASGRTPLQLEHDIAARLHNYMTVPEVTVIVEQINSKKFNILGEISRPGEYSLTLSTTIMDAISMAGGFKEFAKTKGVYILRQNSDGTESRLNFNYKEFIKGKNIAQNVKIEPRDTIIVP